MAYVISRHRRCGVGVGEKQRTQQHPSVCLACLNGPLNGRRSASAIRDNMTPTPATLTTLTSQLRERLE